MDCKRLVLAVSLALAQMATPAISAELGKDLTPVGGEKAGNKAGTIPAWSGMMSSPAGWAVGKKRSDFSPYKNEKPLFSIDASNVEKYADKLSPGQIQLIKQTKGYRMDVYPTHRTCGHPDFVEANTKKNLAEAKIGADGSSLQHANLPGVPFPQPKSGIEAMWNFLTRYQGVGVNWPRVMSYISPRQGSTTPLELYGSTRIFFPWGAKGTTTPEKLNDIYYGYSYDYEQPAALAGQSVVQRFFFTKPVETFFYFPGQRRVRRMPTFSYDSPVIGFESQYMVDQTFLFFGNPDRYDWKIVGKKEMYVPYNGFGMYDADAKLSDVMQPNYVNPANRRYELHRVIEVEANVKSGFRHTSPKRTFFLDEDTWIAVAGDEYDSSGKLWKVKEGFPIPAWEIGACAMTSFLQYDTVTGRYLSDMSSMATGKEMYWIPEAKGSDMNLQYYTSEQLQARSDR